MLDFANQYSLYHTSIECRSRVGLVDEFKILFFPVQSLGLQSIYPASPQNTFPYLRTTPLSFYFMYSRDEFDWVSFNSFFSFSEPMAIMTLHMNTMIYFDCFCHQEFQNIVHDGSLHHSHCSHCLHWFHCFYCLQLHYVWTHYSIMTAWVIRSWRI